MVFPEFYSLPKAAVFSYSASERLVDLYVKNLVQIVRLSLVTRAVSFISFLVGLNNTGIFILK